jgi:hypothetical protein
VVGGHHRPKHGQLAAYQSPGEYLTVIRASSAKYQSAGEYLTDTPAPMRVDGLIHDRPG